MSIVAGIRRGGRAVVWYLKGVMGEDAYDKYAAHHAGTHGAGDAQHPLMSVAEFWRDKTDRQDANPQGRCC